ncbi:hypothetical protein KKB55_05350 [Myxococcota bacterium]|nr:hypothetical protein [Myxococcota bacterium]
MKVSKEVGEVDIRAHHRGDAALIEQRDAGRPRPGALKPNLYSVLTWAHVQMADVEERVKVALLIRPQIAEIVGLAFVRDQPQRDRRPLDLILRYL